jgi:EmrB/QacA subfamily drug resistance transporter
MSRMPQSPAIPTPVEKQNTQPQASSEPSSFKKWAGLGILSLGLAIVIIDTTLLNVSLSYIIRDLHTDIKNLQWVITAYTLVLAAFTVTGGRLGDLFGRRKMFILGAIIFAIGSFLASISTNIGMLLLGESIIEGFGAALMMPATASLVVANFKGKERATAFGVWGAVAGASSAIGPLLGGWLATHYSWRWGFRINIFVAAVVLIGSLWLLKESRDERKPTLDWGGVILSCLALLGISYGIIESTTYGWWKAKQAFELFGHHFNLGGLSITPIAIALGIIILVVFFLWEQRVERNGKSPLVSLSILKNQQFTSGTLVVTLLTLGMTGTFFALPIFLQAVKNIDAFHTGLVFLPLSASLLVVAPLTGIISRKISPKYLIQFGLLMAAIGAIVIRAGISVTGSTNNLIPGLIIFGIGMGFVMAPISHITLSAVPVEQSGEASGINNTMRQVGATLGAAIVGAAVISILISSLVKGVQNSPVIPEQAKSQIVAAVSDPRANVEFGGLNNAATGTPPQISEEIQSLAKQATVQGAKAGYVYAAMFALLGFAAALFLPKTDIHDEEQHENQTSLADDPHRFRKFAAAGVIALIALGGGVYVLRASANKIISTGALPLPQNNIPQNVQSLGLSTSTPENEQPIFPRGPENTSTASSTGATSTPFVYENKEMGFSITLPNGTSASPQKETYEIQFVKNNIPVITIENYDNANTSLEELKIQLKNNPGTHDIRNTVIGGNTAISFLVTRTNSVLPATGYACIVKNKLYYIFIPADQDTSILNSLTFL